MNTNSILNYFIRLLSEIRTLLIVQPKMKKNKKKKKRRKKERKKERRNQRLSLTLLDRSFSELVEPLMEALLLSVGRYLRHRCRRYYHQLLVLFDDQEW